MAMQILLDSETINLLDKYCSTRPSEPELIVDRVLREWYVRAVPIWRKNKDLIPQFPKIPEKQVGGISINSDHARNFYSYCYALELDPIKTASWLVKLFIRNFKIKKMTEISKKREQKKW